MTNEQLVTAIKDGHREYISTLWTNISKLAYKQSHNYYNYYKKLCDSSGITFDDLYQCSFLAMLDGIKNYSDESGCPFVNHYCKYSLKSAFRSATGIRTVKKYPLNDCTSLDTPLSDDDSNYTLKDTINDTGALQDFENVIDNEYQTELNHTLNIQLNTLDNRQKDFITEKYFNNCTLKDISNKYHVSIERVRQIIKQGCKRLKNNKSLQNFANYYHGTGFDTWNRYGSIEERLTEKENHIVI